MVVKNPVTLVLYDQVPSTKPYRTLNTSIPASGPQLIRMLVGLILFELIMVGTVVTSDAMQGGGTLLLELFEEDDSEAAVVTAHVGPLIVLESNDTPPVCARARPFRVAPVAIVMEVDTRIVPIRDVFVPRVAELAALHQTLHGSPPTILAVPEVIKSDADLKIQTPDPLRVRVPVKWNESAQ